MLYIIIHLSRARAEDLVLLLGETHFMRMLKYSHLISPSRSELIQRAAVHIDISYHLKVFYSTMGGSAFTGGVDPLDTPRMPPHVYEAVKARCSAKLRELFICVASPIEGPGKIDHGDIDILVAWPKVSFSDKNTALNAVKTALQAKRAILAMGDTSANFAIPWPEDHGEYATQSRFIQVDVKICDTLQSLQWLLFKHAHGDVWSILGSVIRPYGLTIDEQALYIRIPEIEDVNRKRSRVFLTSEPVEILHFLGLPVSRSWEEPFGSRWELFEYTALCRLFWVRPAEPTDLLDGAETGTAGGGTGRDRAALKSNDRRRMNQRVAFRAWIDDFVSECRRRGLYSVKPTTREAVTEEALDRFRVRKEYNTRRNEFLQERQKEHIVSIIKASARLAHPEDMRAIMYRSCQIKALKRIILEGDESYGIAVKREHVTGEDGFYKLVEIQGYLEDHAEEVGDLAFAKHEKAYIARKSMPTTES
ncbi:hypothetical protein NLU13_5307 [Sarocladium strictum]|uniref:Uncharacterized protein n=1 Tax=Sarocladium strictum TaxID=5046 RepID=A0AA39GGM5_SARSR|nr:hypothetical protein NLU13_5307 [Sarocladium strictum]